MAEGWKGDKTLKFEKAVLLTDREGLKELGWRVAGVVMKKGKYLATFLESGSEQRQVRDGQLFTSKFSKADEVFCITHGCLVKYRVE